MRQKVILPMSGTLLFFLSLFVLSAGQTVASPELIAQMIRTPHRDYIITVKGDLADNNAFITSLDPRDVRVGRGDPVTWINESRGEVRMKFGKGPECKRVTLKALGWRMEPHKCYETEDTLRPGFSTTIRFNEIGVFNYEIEYVDKNRNERGVVRVQSENR